MMVEHCGTLVEAACVPRIPTLELLIVEVVTKFVTELAEKCPE
jgi:hypothetical protein